MGIFRQSQERRNDMFNCKKCDKSYNDMRKLRRHDWRCHRSIECTICSETLDSRQEISGHRLNKHKMFKKLSCKYFPACFDEDECLYEHNNAGNEEKVNNVCSKGNDCSDQSCEFSEQNHRISNPILCRFQERCNRAGCQFMHNSTRKA